MEGAWGQFFSILRRLALKIGFLIVLSPLEEGRAQLSVSFSAVQNTGCVPFAVQFQSLVSGGVATSYSWDFGNGNTSNLPNPVAFFNTPGVFTISLTVSNGTETATAVMQDYITVNFPPQAQFSSSVGATGCGTQEMTFTSTSVAGSTSIVSYFWVLGDGTTDTGQTVTHVYSSPGTFDVMLVVTSADGCQSSLTQNDVVTVAAPPVVASFTAPVTASCQIPFTVSFQNTSTAPPGTQFSWNFGNGQTSAQYNPSTTYTTHGNYTVTLSAYDPQSGCGDTLIQPSYIVLTSVLTAAFQLTNDSICPGQAIQALNQTVPAGVNYAWNFGNGQSSPATNPVFSYSAPGLYQVQLTASAGGCSHQATAHVYVYPQPQAAFSVFPAVSCQLPAHFQFTNQSTGAVSYSWTFGGAAPPSALTNPTISVNTIGSYDVRLIATNSFGCTDTFVVPSAVAVEPLNVSITASPQVACAVPQDVVFQASTSNPNFQITSYQWTFTDGSTSTSASPQVTFTSPGIYGATLIAITSAGCSDTVNNPQLVSLSDGQVVAAMDVQPQVICAGYPVQFINNSLGGLYFTWLLNGNVYSDQFSPTPIFYYPDTFQVSLVGAAPGCAADTAGPITLIILPSSAIYTIQRSCDGSNTVTFSNFDQSATSLFLYPGDGSVVNVLGLSSYTHTYIPGATYMSYALASNNQTGCLDTFRRNFFLPVFNLNFSYNPPVGCAPQVVNFTSNTTGFTSVRWGFGNGQMTQFIPVNSNNPVSNVSHTYVNAGQYNAFLVGAYNYGGGNFCRDTIFNTITIYQPPLVQIEVLDYQGCGPVTVSFHANVSPGASVLWDFGDGSFSTEMDPVHTFSSFAGNTVILTATLNGCTSSDTLSGYDLFPNAPTAQLVITPHEACMGIPVQFNTFVTGFYSDLTWNFGDGTQSTNLNASHTYLAEGTYIPWIVITDTSGCQFYFNSPDTIAVHKPLAQIIPPIVPNICPPVTVTFASASQEAVIHLWDFGNGSTSNLTNPTSVYSLPGQYQASLIVWDQYGCTDTAVTPLGLINIAGPLLDSFLISDKNPCPGQPVQFQVFSPNASVFIVNIDTTGQYIVGNDVSYTYSQIGTYLPFVTLGVQVNNQFCLVNFPPDTIMVAPIVIDALGPPPACYGNPFPLSATGADLYEWFPTTVFPLGNTGFSPVAFPDTSRWVWVLGEDLNGCQDYDSVWLEVYPKPHASFTFENQCVHQPYHFLNTSQSFHPIISFEWDFSSTNQSSLENPIFTFHTPGPHPVQLIITTDQGCKDTAVLSVQVHPLPEASFALSGICEGTPVTAQNQSSVSAPYFLQSFQWLVDEQMVSSSSTLPTPYYLSAGQHQVTLQVTTDAGCMDTFEYNLFVHPQPQAAFSVQNPIACTHQPVLISDISTFPDGPGTIIWHIVGPGGTDIMPGVGGENISYQPSATGDHTVILIAQSIYGCTDTLTGIGMFYVSPPVTANFTIQPSQVSILQPTITVENHSLNYTTLLWDLGDGTTSQLEALQHTYPQAGEYKVTLVAYNEFGCWDDTTALVTVLPEVTLYIPNIFTPGSSPGVNDYFYVKGMSIKEFEILIFDRWGELIFQSDKLDFQWDGTYLDKPVPEGTYVYRIIAKDIHDMVYDFHGHVLVMR